VCTQNVFIKTLSRFFCFVLFCFAAFFCFFFFCGCKFVYCVYYLCFKHNRFVSERDRHSNSESVHMIAEEEVEFV
jgi:hypothetical protein